MDSEILENWADNLARLKKREPARLKPSEVMAELDAFAKAIDKLSPETNDLIREYLLLQFTDRCAQSDELDRIRAAIAEPRVISSKKPRDMLKRYISILIRRGMKPSHYPGGELVQTVEFLCDQADLNVDARRVVRDVLEEMKPA